MGRTTTTRNIWDIKRLLSHYWTVLREKPCFALILFMYIHCSSCFVQPAHGFPLSAAIIRLSANFIFGLNALSLIEWYGLCVVEHFCPILFICPSNDIQGWTKPMLQLHLTHFLRNTFSHLLTNTNTSVQGAWLQLHMKNEKGKIKICTKHIFVPWPYGPLFAF